MDRHALCQDRVPFLQALVLSQHEKIIDTQMWQHLMHKPVITPSLPESVDIWCSRCLNGVEHFQVIYDRSNNTGLLDVHIS
jgi:hypothetical protein